MKTPTRTYIDTDEDIQGETQEVYESDDYDTWEMAPNIKFESGKSEVVTFQTDKYLKVPTVVDNRQKEFWKWKVHREGMKTWLSTTSLFLKRVIIEARAGKKLEGRTFKILKSGDGKNTRWTCEELTKNAL